MIFYNGFLCLFGVCNMLFRLWLEVFNAPTKFTKMIKTKLQIWPIS
jgi:hypothetical protein